ncbi:MAG: hypothetical protein K1X67_18795 [Fimbriimonadaceae bacterium]|nr:hypothetical protein [Fimbriimonadaceae bacterium]
MDKLHFIHSRAGRIGGRADTTPIDVDAIVEGLQRDSRKHLVIHFHGGLVSKEEGLAIAQRLLNEARVYSPSPTTGGHAVFYVWESGAWETIRNNLTELADEPVFKQLLRKLVQYTLERLGAKDVVGTRSISQSSCGALASEVSDAFDAFWNQPGRTTIPYRDFAPLADAAQARSASLAISEDEIQADLEQDVAFLASLATLPDLPSATRSAFAPQGAVERRSAFSELASREFSKHSATRGLVELFQVAKFIVRVLRGVLRRYSGGRDHGLYATCVEELIRGFKIAGSGLNEWGKALEWNRMKQDTADAFGPDPDAHAGTALLARLGVAIAKGLSLDRLTLIGHSTGAIYIAHWLEASKRYLPEALKQDVVLLAPAITHDFFATTLQSCGMRIGGFRMFAMRDALERDDQVWGQDDELRDRRDWRRYLYPSSLLYLVSGLLESRRNAEGEWEDEPDMPILGMERFLANTQIYGDASFPSVKVVREWLGADARRVVWSQTTSSPIGLNSECIDHGSFDNDSTTLDSLREIVVRGF